MHEQKDNVLTTYLNQQFDTLAPILQKAHLGKTKLSGYANIKHGNFIAKIINTVFGFPKSGERVPLEVICDHSPTLMTWQRNFNGQRMNSSFYAKGEFFMERLGPLSLSMKAVARDKKLHYQYVKTHLLGIPMPQILSPQIVAYEEEIDGYYAFTVKVSMFLIGEVITYNGRLSVEPI